MIGEGATLIEKFDFLGYTFRARDSRDRFGRKCINFAPAVSNESAKRMRRFMRKWRLHLRSDKSLLDLSIRINPVLRGWIYYYGKYHKSQLYPTFDRLNQTLTRWVMRKYKRFNKRHKSRAWYWLGRIAKQNPDLFAHWRIIRPMAGREWTYAPRGSRTVP